MTGRDGLLRQVGSAEIVAQVAFARTKRFVRKVVFMGMGEPAHNLDNVMEAIDLLGTAGGIGHKNLVFSTVGDPRVFERLPQSPVKPALALSLHTTRADLREQLLPRAPRMDPAELVADKGYHSRDGLKGLEDGAWKSRIAEKRSAGVNRWRGDEEARRAVYNNRARLRSGVAKEAFKLRAELVERSFALTLDRGGMRRAWLRGRDNLKKRYLVYVAGYNLGLIMRLLVGAGTPREFLAGASARLLALTTADAAVLVVLTVAAGTETAMLVVALMPEPLD
jgi:hypothetical protein